VTLWRHLLKLNPWGRGHCGKRGRQGVAHPLQHRLNIVVIKAGVVKRLFPLQGDIQGRKSSLVGPSRGFAASRSFAAWLTHVSSSSPAHWTTWWRHASWGSAPCRQRWGGNFCWVAPSYSRPRRRVGHRLWRCWTRVARGSMGMLSMVRSMVGVGV